jgi:CheY-like chemotaxis protein
MEPNQTTQILVVEDDADDSFLLMREIERAQLDDHVRVMVDGQEALDFLLKAKNPPLAIFLDLYLPGLNGIPLMERLRQDSRYEHVPIIVMTGSVNPNDAKACIELGVTSYLPKPVKLTSFIKTVAHIFPKSVARQ